MTTLLHTEVTTTPARPGSLRRRLAPLLVATFLQGVGFWVPVEKLFMSQIGFTAAQIGVMAAVYAAVVPLLEVPAGLLADRWSRRGVLVLSSLALAATALVCGLSSSVSMYTAGAAGLGAYFALYSGSIDSVVYDTVLEETGSGDHFERQLGRVRALESAALVSSALLGGWLAMLTSTRLMYFLTIPFTIASIVAYLAFREPRIHESAERTSLAEHVRQSVAAVRGNGALVPVIALTVLTSVALTLLFEFGPVWLVATASSALLFGPHWAALMSMLGIGGLLAGRLDASNPKQVSIAVGGLLAAAATLTVSRHVAVITAAQATLVLLVVLTSIHAASLLHHEVASQVRASVSSAVSALSWIVFLPIAVGFGALTDAMGIHTAGWILVVLAAGMSLILATAGARAPRRLTGRRSRAVE